MISLWWLGLALLAAPIWWHRQKRQRVLAQPLATARFLPRADPQQLRVWRFADPLLLLLRCLLLAALVAWLADLVLPWRGDAVLLVKGTDPAWAEQQIKEAGLSAARRIELPDADAFAWLARHEREWQADARLLVLGDVPMPDLKPAFRHQLQVRSKAAPPAKTEQRVAIVSQRGARWRAMFEGLDGPRRYLVDEAPDARSQLIIWDVAQAPPPGLRAPLWWVADATAFPELKHASVADSARGRLWALPEGPPADPDAARALFSRWQRLHVGVPPYTTPAQTLAPGQAAPVAQASGALRYILTLVLLALFALERLVTHARRR